MKTILSVKTTTDGLKPSSLMALALEAPSSDETQPFELPAKIIVTRTPAEFVSMRCAILSELASELIRTNPPAEIQAALMLLSGERGSISIEVLELDATTAGLN
jgi:hypothetical protein